jgi:3-oxoacyl-[acyl-carrier protein] reductase
VGRTALVTGVSRRQGIGFAIARRLLADPHNRVFAHSFSPYDATEPWDADPGGIAAVLQELGGGRDRLAHREEDLADPEAPSRLLEAATASLGAVDTLVRNHARSQTGTLDALAPEALDATWAINVRVASARPGLRRAVPAAPGRRPGHPVHVRTAASPSRCRSDPRRGGVRRRAAALA